MNITKLFSFLVLFIASVMFSTMPVSAFEDDFNDDDMSDWTISSGTWATSNVSSIEGANDYYAFNYIGSGVVTNDIYKFNNIDYSYYEFDLLAYGSIANSHSSYTRFVFESNGVDERSIALNSYTDVPQTHYYIEIVGDGFTFTDTMVVDGSSFTDVNKWFHFEISLIGSNIKINVYDDTDTLILTQTNPYTRVSNKDRFIARNYNDDSAGGDDTDNKAGFDNIYMSGTAPSTINGIEWDAEQYIEGDTASYTWALQNSFWQNLIYKYRIQILKDGSEIDSVKVSQTGTRYQEVDTAGTYEVKLQYSGLIFTNWISIDSDSVNVIPEVDSFINVPSTSAIKTNFTATYLYGSTPISPIINIKELQNDYTYKVIDTKILPAAAAGTTYTTNLSISTVGYYVVDLYDNGKGKSHATDTIQTNYVYVPPLDVVLSSYIDTSMTNYSFGGAISGSYAIEDTNYTDYHTRVEIYNVDKDVISFAYEPLHQIDAFDIPITDFIFYDDGENVYVVNTNFLSGNNRIQLSAYNTDGSLNEVIAHKNITISATDEEGYGLSLSKYNVVENEVFAIKAITPVQASIIISPLTLMGVSDTTILINGSTQLSHALGIEDTYRISLVSSGETKSSVIITVLEGEEITVPTEEEAEPEVSFGTKFESMLSSGAFIALLIIIACVGAFGKIGGVVGVFLGMVVGISISFLMGYLPAWILFIMVLALCVVFVSKLINSFGGGE